MATQSEAKSAGWAGARLRLSLKWKAFGLLLLLLGGVLGVFSYLSYRSLVSQTRQFQATQLEGYRTALKAVLAQSRLELGLLAAQMANSVSAADLDAGHLTAAPASSELMAALDRVVYFEPEGRLIGAWVMDGSERLPAQQIQHALEIVRRNHAPIAFIACPTRCIHVTFVPAFDRDGKELVVEVARDAADVLLAFRQLSGTDLALLAPGVEPRPLWGRHVPLLTSAPTLTPVIEKLRRAGLPAPAQGASARLVADGRDLALVPEPLAQSVTIEGLDVMFVVDETSAHQFIADEVRRAVTDNLVGLTLSGLALFLLIGVATRRLSAVTDALPVLAEQRFDAASAALAAIPANAALPDEVDVLRETALWLTHRLKTLNAAEAASEAKSRFLAAMSHEIRTPMNGVLGMLEILTRSRLDSDQQQQVRVIHQSARALLGVLDDVLDFSKIEAGRVQLESVPLSLEELVEESLGTLSATAHSRPIRLMTFVDPALPARVMGDPVRLRQILLNLCGNAVKFTHSGRVVLRADLESAEQDAVQVRFRVVDSGIGIQPADQALLFKPFSQAESSTTRRYGGTGLGLSIVRGLVERMQGSVGVDSEVGRGSEFWVRLRLPIAPGSASVMPASARPLDGVHVELKLDDPVEVELLGRYFEAAGASVRAPGAPPLAPGVSLIRLLDAAPGDSTKGYAAIHLEGEGASSAAITLWRPISRRQLIQKVLELAGRRPAHDDETPAPGAYAPLKQLRGRVLIAEDHPLNREVAERQLKLLGLDTDAAEDGLAALEYLAKRDYAVLITDLYMPRMDGYALAQQVRLQEADGRRSGRLPIIAMTADVMKGVIDRCQVAGMDDYVSKPVSLAELSEHLGRWLPQAAESGTATFDRAALKKLVGGDDALIDSLLEKFIGANDGLLATMRGEVQAGDLEALRRSIHRFIGSARTLVAQPLVVALERLQKAARGGDRAALPAGMEEVAREYARLRAAAGLAPIAVEQVP